MRWGIILFGVIFSSALMANLPLRGQGDYKWLFIHVYEAKLWAPIGENLYEGPLKLELTYKRDLKGKDIARQSIVEMTKAGHSNNELQVLEKDLVTIFPDVKKGDSISAHYSPGNGIVFFLNNNIEIGRITNLNFSKKFLDIWLGEKTSAPELRKQLLGNI